MDNGASTDALSLVSTLLRDPETVSRLMGAISEISAQKNEGGGEVSEVSEAAVGSEDLGGDEVREKLSGVMAALSGGGSQGARANDRHTALLLAIKPYLSPKRAELIDDLIKLGSVGELLRGLENSRSQE